MILRTSPISIILIFSLLQSALSYGGSNCPAIQSQWHSYVGNRVIANRRCMSFFLYFIFFLLVDENVCGEIRGGGDSCCTREMLMGMSEASEHEVRRILKNLLETNAENFRNDTITLKSKF